MRCAYLLVLLFGCVHVAPPAPLDRQAIDDTRAAWHAAGLPDPGACGELVEVRRHRTVAAYVDACSALTPGMYGDAARESAGCTTTALRGAMGREVAVIHVAPKAASDMGLVQHELLHRMYVCVYGDPNADHADARVWYDSGGMQSVEIRAARN